ncbi:MAG: group II intron reverse transcriptase/maturase [Holosporales bacterium]|nr:group II intron reverse transcriptase/maturase [Holosporales bacterium]
MENPAYQFDISTDNLMEIICSRSYLNLAYKKVCQNKGIPGIDNISVKQLGSWIKDNQESFLKSMLDGTYKPKPVKGIFLPKPKGKGKRCIGVLSVIDRFVQQAILQVINDPIDLMFSDHSYGFRKNKSALEAVQQAKSYILEGHTYVADIDIAKFFDNIHHDMIVYKLSKIVKDKRVLRIVRKFLQSGMLKYNTYEIKEKGIYQGGSLSPLLSNLLLHDLDILLEHRGHKFCRYADDIKIYTKSLKAAERVLLSVEKYLEKHLKLTCNKTKTKACKVNYSEFLGYKIDDLGKITAIPENIQNLKYKIKKLTKRSRFRDLTVMIKDLNQVIVGWTSYFRYDYRKGLYQDIDSLLRRRIRANILRRAVVMKKKGTDWVKSIGGNPGSIDFNKLHWHYSLTIRKANYIIPLTWFNKNNLRSIFNSKEKYRNSVGS